MSAPVLYYEHYFRRLESIQVQFDFARKAIKGFIESSDDSGPSPGEPKPTEPLSTLLVKDDDEWVEKIVKYMEALKGGFPEKHKDLENRLAQNEVILIVAVFEDQMKAIHREVLRQNPSLLNPDREIKLGKNRPHPRHWQALPETGEPFKNVRKSNRLLEVACYRTNSN